MPTPVTRTIACCLRTCPRTKPPLLYHHRSRIPGGVGCSYGTEQAKSVAVSWARGRLGRVAFREAAVMADVASDMAYLGRVGWNQQPPSCPFRSTAGPWPRKPAASSALEPGWGVKQVHVLLSLPGGPIRRVADLDGDQITGAHGTDVLDENSRAGRHARKVHGEGGRKKTISSPSSLPG